MNEQKSVEHNAVNINVPLLCLAYSSLFLFGLIDNGRGPAYPRLIELLGENAANMSWMFTLSSISALLCGLASHLWLKSIGPIRGFGLFFVCMGIGSILIAMAPDLGHHGFLVLLIGSIMFGGGGGGSSICMNMMVGKAVPAHHLQKAYGALHSLYGVSSFCAPLLVNLFTGAGHDWRMLFYLSGALCLVASVLTFYQFPAEKNAEAERAITPLWNQATLILAVTLGIYVAGEVLISSRLVHYLEAVAGFNKVRATEYLGHFFVFLLTGRSLIIVLPVRLESILWPIGLMLGATLLFFLGTFFDPFWLCVNGLLIGPIFPLTFTWMKNTFGINADGMVPTVLNGVSMGVISMHFLVGLGFEHFGVEKTFNLGPWTFLAAALVLIFCSQRLKRL